MRCAAILAAAGLCAAAAELKPETGAAFDRYVRQAETRFEAQVTRDEVLVPGATVQNALDIVQAYGRHKEFYRPEVVDSCILWRFGAKYYRVPSPEFQTIPGTGLSLTLVAQIVKAHGGRVDLNSAPAQGSAFTIRLGIGNGS